MLDADVRGRTRPSSLRRDVLSGLGAWAVLVGLVGLGGVLARTSYGWWYRFDLDQEQTLPAWVSGVALVVAGAGCVRASRRGVAGSPLLAVGALLMVMGADEVFLLHERLEASSGVDWQVLYLPVMAAAGLAFLAVTWRLRRLRWFVIPWLAGAALWVLAQGLEYLQWDGAVRQPGYTRMMLVEEVSELAGTGCFLVATWAVSRRRDAVRSGGPEASRV